MKTYAMEAHFTRKTVFAKIDTQQTELELKIGALQVKLNMTKTSKMFAKEGGGYDKEDDILQRHRLLQERKISFSDIYGRCLDCKQLVPYNLKSIETHVNIVP